MDKQQATEMGKQHASDGKQLTPFDCREFDKVLFAQCRHADRPAKLYAQLRGAFNKGWHAKHIQQLFA